MAEKNGCSAVLNFRQRVENERLSGMPEPGGLGTGECSMVRAALVATATVFACGSAGADTLRAINMDAVSSAGVCSAVRLDVRVRRDGDIVVNDIETDLQGLQVAAMAKDDACQDVPAKVNYVLESAAPHALKNEVRYWLNHIVQNIALNERVR